jgi:hypothetical protein
VDPGVLIQPQPRGNVLDEKPTFLKLVFIGKPGSTSDQALAAQFEASLQAARAPGGEPHVVKDLRALQLVFN